MGMTDKTGIPVGAHTTGSLTTAIAITRATAAGGQPADFVLIVSYGGNARVTFDGTTPTATLGFQLSSGLAYNIMHPINDSIKIIGEGGSETYQLQQFVMTTETNQ